MEGNVLSYQAEGANFIADDKFTWEKREICS